MDNDSRTRDYSTLHSRTYSSTSQRAERAKNMRQRKVAQASGVYRSRRAKPRWGRIGLVSGIFLLVLILAGAGGFWLYVGNFDSKTKKTNAFDGLDNRPTKVVDGALDILLIGSDNTEDGERANQSVFGERSDSIIILHIPKSQDKAYLISIPRDTYVYVPSNGKGDGGYKTKINAAFAWGKEKLLVQTIEELSNIHIDHTARIDFNGFQKMTDAVGGVDVMVNSTVYDKRSKRTFTKGINHLDGAAALDYVRQRKELPGGDFDRVKRQQIFLKSLLNKATSQGILTSPTKLNDFVNAAAGSLTVDENFSLRDMVWQFKSLRSDDIVFITMPHSGSKTINGSSVVVRDVERSDELFNAVKNDTVGSWVSTAKVNSADQGN